MTKGLLVAGLALATVVRLALAWSDIDLLVEKCLPDDAFYYFQIARRLSAGEGVSFDGLTTTNGFHPLWLLAIVPFFRAFPDDAALPIHLSLTLATILNVATAWFAHALTRHLTANPLASACAGLLYAFNAYVILESLNGLETSLANLLFAATVWYYVTRADRFDLRRAAILGVLGAAAILARTDSVFLLAAIALALLASRQWRTQLGPVSLLLTIAAVLVAPWPLWSSLAAGSAVQTSGLAVPFVLHHNIAPDLGTGTRAQWMVSETLNSLRMALSYGGVWRLPVAFVLPLVALWMAERRHDPSLKKTLAKLNCILAAHAATVLFHGAYRLYPRSWYFAPVAFLGAVYLGVVIDHGLRRTRDGVAGVAIHAAVGLVVAANLLQLWGHWARGKYPWQAEMLAAARWAQLRLDPPEKLAAFNAGILAYWNPERTVVNLDGVVNTAAFAAIRERALWKYMQRVGIRYLIDYEVYAWQSPADFSLAYGPFFGTQLADHVEVIERIPGTLHGSDILALRLTFGSR
jgi:hypothetical protein